MMFQKRIGFISLALFSGALTGAGVAVPFLWPLVFLGPIPFLWLLFRRSAALSAKSIFYLGALFGLGLYLLVLISGWSAYPLSWAGVGEGFLSASLVIIVWLSYSAVAALPFGLFALFVRALCKKTFHGALILLGTIFFWVIAEQGSAFFFSILSLGTPAPLSFDFTMGALGYALSHAEAPFFLLPAKVGGLPLLSAAALFPSLLLAGIASLPAKRARVLLPLALPTLLFALLWAGLFLSDRVEGGTEKGDPFRTGEEMKIVVVRTDFPSLLSISDGEASARGEVIRSALRGIGEGGFPPDIVVFPEAVAIAEYLPDFKKEFAENLPPETLIINSGRHRTLFGREILETRFYGRGGEIEGRIDKQFSMPFGEYLPYFFQALTSVVHPKLMQNLREHRTYKSGKTLSLPHAKGTPVGARLCSETFSPRLYRELKEAGAKLLVTLSSATIFHSSPLFVESVRSAARVRAVENGLPMIVAFNGGDPSLFDCRGAEIPPQRVEQNLFFFILSSSTVCSR